ncbi:MAG: acyltransferase [Cellvibrio sp. 79]|nr:MAG: acyltransferase [Cellvibrio sp. 79]
MFASLRGVLVTAIFSITIIMVTVPIVFFALLRLIPIPAWQHLLNPCLDASANFWIRVNNVQQNWLLPTRLEIDGVGNLDSKEWYMLVANHQAWADILIVVRTFGTRIPGVKFFFKRSLLWVPVLGLALWGLDFPSMSRHSKAAIARDPSLKGRDLARTRKACARFRHHPVTIINFLEGTRFTPEKHQQQNSVYRHLLMPRAGGLAFALNAMDGQLHQLLDLTIHYEGGIPSYWNYVCGNVKTIRVQVRQVPIPADLLGDYEGDLEFRARFQQWVNTLWQQKDEALDALSRQQ